MSRYDEAFRRELKQAVLNAGVTPPRAAQAIDLACHAADRGFEELSAVVRRAPDMGIGMMALELALQLAMARMQGMLERTWEFGKTQGVTQTATEIRVPR